MAACVPVITLPRSRWAFLAIADISVLLLSRLLGAAEPEEGPEGEGEDEGERDGVGREDARRLAGQEAAGGVEDGGKRIQAGDGFEPALQEVQRDEDRGQKQDQEDGSPDHRPRLLRAHQHRHPRPEERRRDVHEDGQPDQTEEVEAALNRHPHEERDNGDERPGGGDAHERGYRVTEDYPGAVRGGEHQPFRETVLEVPGDGEPGECPAHRDRLQESPDVLEGDVAPRIVEAGHVAYPRQSPGEGDEEEDGEERRRQKRGVGEVLVDLASRHRPRYREKAAHRYAALALRDAAAPPRLSTTMAAAQPKPRVKACASQPVITRLRIPSTR